MEKRMIKALVCLLAISIMVIGSVCVAVAADPVEVTGMLADDGAGGMKITAGDKTYQVEGDVDKALIGKNVTLTGTVSEDGKVFKAEKAEEAK